MKLVALPWLPDNLNDEILIVLRDRVVDLGRSDERAWRSVCHGGSNTAECEQRKRSATDSEMECPASVSDHDSSHIAK